MLLAAVCFGSRSAGIATILSTVATVAPVWVASVLLHEFGHISAARLVGFHPFALLVGGGPRILRSKLAGMVLDIGVLPGSGLSMFTLERRTMMRWRLALVYASGPLVTAILLLSAVCLPITPGASASIREAAMFVNGVLLLTSLWPLRASTKVPGPRNDLLQLLNLPRVGPSQIDALVDGTRAVPFSQLMLLGDYEAAEHEALRVLQASPKDISIRFGLAELLLLSEAYTEAAPHYRALLDGEWLVRAEPDLQALVANNYAWALCRIGGASNLEAADHWSTFALNRLPNHSSVVGTRGSVLVEQGQVTEGSALLRRSIALHKEPYGRATNYAYLAIGCAREGRFEQAEAFLRSALAEDKRSAAIARAREVILEQQSRPKNAGKDEEAAGETLPV